MATGSSTSSFKCFIQVIFIFPWQTMRTWPRKLIKNIPFISYLHTFCKFKSASEKYCLTGTSQGRTNKMFFNVNNAVLISYLFTTNDKSISMAKYRKTTTTTMKKTSHVSDYFFVTLVIHTHNAVGLQDCWQPKHCETKHWKILHPWQESPRCEPF